jgi:hypothetical protein
MKLPVVIALLSYAAVNGRAGVIVALDPAPLSVALGSQAIFTVDISGLGGGVSPALGTYDLSVSFDPTLLAYNNVVFGNQLDPDGFGSNIRTVTPGTGTLEIFELSLDPAADLVAAEPAAFTLATFTFDTLSSGNDSPLTLTSIAVGDEQGNDLAPSLANSSVTVMADTSAPEPNGVALLFSGLAVVWGLARLRK